MNDFFHYTKTERIGIFVLLALCLVVWMIPSFFPDSASVSIQENERLYALATQWERGGGENNETRTAPTENQKRAQKTVFNPNTANKATLEAFDLPASTIRSWLSFTSKGGYWKDIAAMQNFRALQAEDLRKLEPYLRFNETSDSAKLSSGENDIIAKLQPVTFDPNAVTMEELQAMGLSDRVSKTWSNFTSKGGRFRSPEDIKQIYGLSEDDANELIAFVVLEETTVPQSYDENAATQRIDYAAITIDINQSNAADWEQLRGIGPAFSNRIVNFRDKLGGFHSINQIAETYGLPDSTFQKIKPQLVASDILNSLAINNLDADGLAAHPYINYKEANAIINYRNNHGPFTSLTDLGQVLALRSQTLDRIKPYLAF